MRIAPQVGHVSWNLRGIGTAEDLHGRHQYARPDGAPDTTSVETQRRQYEAVRASVLSRQGFNTRRDLATQVVLLIVASVLFLTHWKWLQRSRAHTV